MTPIVVPSGGWLVHLIVDLGVLAIGIGLILLAVILGLLLRNRTKGVDNVTESETNKP